MHFDDTLLFYAVTFGSFFALLPVLVVGLLSSIDHDGTTLKNYTRK